jgi:arabinogalactan endo-1,4-beta-galactosidase
VNRIYCFIILAALRGCSEKPPEETEPREFIVGGDISLLDKINDFGGTTCQDLAHTLKLAQRIKNSGMKLLLNFHYSDTWADPGKQNFKS